MFSSSEEALALFNRTITTSVDFDAFGGRDVFTAVVLSTPIMLKHAVLGRAATKADRGSKILASTLNRGTVTTFAFKARIIDEPSPHAYLPDPCQTALSDNPEAQLRKIFLHTTFISDNDYNSTKTDVPIVGDKVLVRLQKNVFSYDMSFGSYLSIDRTTVEDTTRKNSSDV